MQYIGSLEAAEKHISAKNFIENLHTSIKILQICMDLQDSVQRSLQIPAEKSCRSAQIRKDRKPGLLEFFDFNFKFPNIRGDSLADLTLGLFFVLQYQTDMILLIVR